VLTGQDKKQKKLNDMGSLERKQRIKEETRINILEAALTIVKKDGWQALSMRRIADMIEYTAPVIYEYFQNKEAILMELSRTGFIRLSQLLKKVRSKNLPPEQTMTEMWLAYWKFAFEEKEYYKLMFGVDTQCPMSPDRVPESELPEQILKSAIKRLYNDRPADDAEVAVKYYTYWAIVHGLTAINMVHRGDTDMLNSQVLIESILSINNSIRCSNGVLANASKL
jgi:AcrR family transcriptional regulator